MNPYLKNYNAISNAKIKKENKFKTNDDNFGSTTSTKYSKSPYYPNNDNQEVDQRQQNKEDETPYMKQIIDKNNIDIENDVEMTYGEEENSESNFQNKSQDKIESNIKEENYPEEVNNIELNELIIDTNNLRINNRLDTKFVSYKKNITNRRRQKSIKSNLSASYNDKIETLKTFIQDIQNSGFEKVQSSIKQNYEIKTEYENNVKILQNNLKMNEEAIKSSKDTRSKLETEINTTKLIQERMLSDRNLIEREMIDLKGALENLNFEIIGKNEETKFILQQNSEIRHLIDIIKDDIKKYNKMISCVNREKENIKSGLLFLKKHSIILKGKIINTEKQSNNFLKEVETLKENSI